ncbi:hypothetical protein HOY82DRAFT_627041 [Tuber indicum]|nr:hypothetical protein HOY82DRAFT_627041 [Tuber indicum]
MRGPLTLWSAILLSSIRIFFIAKPILAGFDFQKCCTQVPVSEELKPHQWDACHSSYNSSKTDPSKKWAPKIETTYAWCHEFCEASGDFQLNSTSRWLSPVTAWIIPTAALLLLLPISEHLKSNEHYFKRTKWQNLWENAFNGALAQMIADWRRCLSMQNMSRGERERDLILIVILAEQADFSGPPVRNAIELMAGSSRARVYIRNAGKVIWSARKKLNTAVALPVALYIGVAAAVFHDAYQKLGDNSTSHSLAYGVWYSWILLLSAFANCFASHSNLDAVRSGMETILRGVIENHTIDQLSDIGWDNQEKTLDQSYDTAVKSLSPYPALHPPIFLNPRDRFSGNIECKGVPLHKRYQNIRNWVRWLLDKGVDISPPTEGIWSHPLLNAVTHVAKDTLGKSEDTPEKLKHPLVHQVVRVFYHVMTWVNAIVILIGGSILQLAGVFENCWCKAGIVGRNANSIVILTPNTHTHQYWAKALWLKVAYAAYGEVGLFCVIALCIRLCIASSVRQSLI